MALLRFSFGTMGSGKSTVALQIHHNLASRGLQGLLLTRLDRDGTQVTSRLGVAAPAVEVGDRARPVRAGRGQTGHSTTSSATRRSSTRAEQCDQLARVVDELAVDVYAFGLITDFRGLLFDGTKRMLEIADERVPIQVEARCWCGARATHNARLVNGRVVYEGETSSWSATPRTPRTRCSATPSATSCSAAATTATASSAERYFQAQGMRLMPWMNVALQVVGLAGDLDVGQAAEQLLEHHRDLAAGEVGAEAEVRAAGAEADLLVAACG